MIETREQFIMQGADYSAQEPRILTQLCEDINMLRAYTVGKDLYVEIAAISFNLPYKLCLEHFPKGCPIKKVNDKWVFAKLKTGEDDDILDFTQFGRYLEEDFDPELYDYEKLADGETDVFEAGYELRNAAKRILLGIMYGRGASSIAEQLYGKTDDKEQAKQNMEKAQAIKDKVYVAFPGIKIFEDESKRKALLYGYVTDLWGRKRRLSNYRLPRLEFFYIGSKGEILKNMEVPSVLKNQYTQQYNNLKWDNKREFIDKLKATEQILIIDNSSKIADAERQIINSQVQGCLDGNVRVQSKEFGIVKIKDFVGKTLTLWDGHEWTPGTIVSSGKKQKCIIHFIGGQKVICSPDHKFETILTNSHHVWRKCKDLQHGLHVEINHEYVPSDFKYCSVRKNAEPTVHNANNVYVDDMSDKFKAGRVLGRLASDGTISVRDDGGSVAMHIIAEHEWSIIPEIEKAMIGINALPTKYDSIRENRQQRIAHISVFSKTFARELTECLDIKHQIHDNIFQDTELLRGFISGFFDGDGGISGNSIRLTFGKQYNFIPLIQDLQKALLFFGIRSSYFEFSARYVLQIKKSDASKFAKIIGFLNSEKQEQALQIAAIKDEHVFGPNLCVDYVEITDEFIDMYDVCNTKNGYFIADGLVTHNSAADMSKMAMISILNDPELIKRLVKIIIPIHDEIIIEVPLRFARYTKNRFAEDMKNAAKPKLTVPVSCDVVNSTHWTGEEIDLDELLGDLPDI